MAIHSENCVNLQTAWARWTENWFKKHFSHSGEKRLGSGLFWFWRRQNTRNPRSERPHYFLSALVMRQDFAPIVCRNDFPEERRFPGLGYDAAALPYVVAWNGKD